jgi:hypothetical protein
MPLADEEECVVAVVEAEMPLLTAEMVRNALESIRR